MKCKYNIVRNGDTKHLCDDNCFKVFRARPTSFLQSDSASSKASAAASNKAAGAAGKAWCDNCQQYTVTAAAAGKFVMKVGKQTKIFCRQV
jgi:YHS domain-containing protein